MKNIVGIGANVYDTLITVDGYPKEDTKMGCASVLECGGGPCGTALAAAARLGGDCAYIGALADDAGGRFLYADLEKFGISTEYVEMKSGSTSFASYVLLNSENATRTCVFSKNNLPEYELDQNKLSAVENADILLIDGNEMKNAQKAVEYAKNHPVKVLYDAGGLYDGVENLLPYVDILIPSEEFALQFTGEKTAENAAKALYERFSPEVIVITQGKKGGILFLDGEIKTYPAFSVEAVDSNGAGDVFHGAFAFAASAGFSYYDACIFSSAVSAIKCTKVGARDAVPNYQETIKFLKGRGYHEFKETLER